MEGSYCSFERFYYDSIFGQLKETYPKWEGFNTLSEFLKELNDFLVAIANSEDLDTSYTRYELDSHTYDLIPYENIEEYHLFTKITCQNDDNEGKKLSIINELFPKVLNYGKIISSFSNLKANYKSFKDDLSNLSSKLGSIKTDFEILKTKFIDEFYYFARIAKGWGRILTTIYFSILLSVTTFACVSMMFYACLRRHGYLSTFMHVLWNIIRFFIFSFFFYGGAYGMCYLAL